jgi:hypothetical protein
MESEMPKRAMFATAVAVAVVGVAAAIPRALAIGNDTARTSTSGTGACQTFGNSAATDDLSPQFSLVQGSLGKP